ncbi:MAG: VOC family protein [Chloroflexi bacterium]|nr:VOC family protein [Chloroflexota bacterium]
MGHIVNHVHLKSEDPKKTADWFVEAFGLEIRSDDVREAGGDRFLRCYDGNGFNINISGQRDKLGEKLGPASADPRFGLEHFGFDVDDMDSELKRLTGLGAELKEGPIDAGGGLKIAFISVPGPIRIELIQRP